MSGVPVRLPPVRVEATFIRLSETIDWGLAAYHVPQHWLDTQGEGVRVAMLDTGIDQQHPDLAGAIDDAEDFTGSPFGPADRNGHGTHTSGTVAARKNEMGVVGIAPQCRLLIAKVLGDDGSGSSAHVAAGLDWACDSGAQIISMSLGASRPDSTLQAAIQRAAAKGIFVVAAAGNDGRDNSVDYPARWKETIAVAAVERNGQLAKFSSRGPEIDIAAPGQDVLSTYLGGTYAKLSGTSMAAPFVAGVVALLVALQNKQPGSGTIKNIAELRDYLQRTAIDAGPAGKDPGYGWGLINPDGLLAPTETTQPPSDAPWTLGGITVNGREGVLVFQPR